MKNGLDVMLNKLQISEKEVVALKAEKQKFQDELKNTTNTSLTSVKNKENEKKTKVIVVKAAANKNSANSNEKLVKVLVQKQTEKKKNATVKKIHLLSPSVQKAPRQVQNSHHAKSHQKVPPSPHGKPPHMKRRFQQIHTCQGKYQDPSKCGSQNQLDQQAEESCSHTFVSTQPEVVSTLETLPREPFVPVWESVSTHPMGRSTHSG
ncbi:hypothetical protein Taro_035328 [Colocasia esculenta]|uniref:Uncharacterized protein n=1 Tax=Colocasia esculenta TaxID=4460 RepID=A0A843VYR4_COLES|nr:hypothetical protein [Colocasia esculenta]